MLLVVALRLSGELFRYRSMLISEEELSYSRLLFALLHSVPFGVLSIELCKLRTWAATDS
jgi:hypothetical protein